MDGPQTEPRSGGFAPWVLLPLGGLLILVIAISRLPGSDCDGLEDPGSTAEIVLIALTALASLGCIGAAVRRLLALGRAGRDIGAELAMAGIGIAVALVLVSILSPPDSGFSFSVLAWLLGMVATGLLMLGLVVAWLAGRRVDEVGSLVPLYLLGTALFVYPGFTLFALAATSGAFC